MNMLLHVCCGPCAAFPVKFIREQGIDITGYFYNPNIHPYREFSRRLNTAREFAEKTDFNLIVDDRYLLDDFLGRALASGDGRCLMCYELRLRQTARFAKKEGFDCFSTTLLVSPYQRHNDIRTIANQIAGEEEIAFWYYDFRSGYSEGVRISKELELYRQPYCGCIFSERDRYQKPRREE